MKRVIVSIRPSQSLSIHTKTVKDQIIQKRVVDFQHHVLVLTDEQVAQTGARINKPGQFGWYYDGAALIEAEGGKSGVKTSTINKIYERMHSVAMRSMSTRNRQYAFTKARKPSSLLDYKTEIIDKIKSAVEAVAAENSAAQNSIPKPYKIKAD